MEMLLLVTWLLRPGMAEMCPEKYVGALYNLLCQEDELFMRC